MAEKVLMLALSPTMETGTIAKWSKQEGEPVKSGDILCEVETDKAVMEYESTLEGTLLKILLPQGGEAQIGDTIAIIGKQGEDITALLAEATAPKTIEQKATPVIPEAPSVLPEQERQGEGRIKISPLARKMAQENNLNLSSITGSGPGGRIIKRDIEQALTQRPATVAPPGAIPTVTAMPTLTDETFPVSAKRKVIAQRLAASKFSAPHYYLKVSARMDEILYARTTLNARLQNKVSLNAFLIKFAAEAIKKHPIINSTWNGDTITRHGSIDIGLAVAQPDGLITPIVRNCGQKGILAIEDELHALIQKAQSNRLTPEEYTGATFTISNLGSFGIQEFTAIINPPGSAILAVGEIRKEPVVNDQDQIVIQANLKLTLSCDHRVIDGVTGAAFLKALKEMLESPISVLY